MTVILTYADGKTGTIYDVRSLGTTPTGGPALTLRDGATFNPDAVIVVTCYFPPRRDAR